MEIEHYSDFKDLEDFMEKTGMDLTATYEFLKKEVSNHVKRP